MRRVRQSDHVFGDEARTPSGTSVQPPDSVPLLVAESVPTAVVDGDVRPFVLPCLDSRGSRKCPALRTDGSRERLFHEQEEVDDFARMFGVSGLVDVPQSQGFYENLEAANFSGLFGEVGHEIPCSGGPYSEETHRIRAPCHTPELVVFGSNHQG